MKSAHFTYRNNVTRKYQNRAEETFPNRYFST